MAFLLLTSILQIIEESITNLDIFILNLWFILKVEPASRGPNTKANLISQLKSDVKLENAVIIFSLVLLFLRYKIEESETGRLLLFCVLLFKVS